MNEKKSDTIYLQVNVAFIDNLDVIEIGPNLTLPKDETLPIFDTERLLIFGTLLEKKNDSALIAVSVFEKLEEDQHNLIESCDVIIEGLGTSTRSAQLNYSNFTVMLIASFDEIVETRLCYDPECLTKHEPIANTAKADTRKKRE